MFGREELCVDRFPLEANWSKTKIRDEIVKYRVENNHSVGIRYTFQVLVDNEHPLCVEILDTAEQSFLKIAYTVDKISYKYNAKGISTRHVFDV